MTQKESLEFALCFSAYLENIRQLCNTDAANAANMATDMIKHLIKTFPKIKNEILTYEDGETLLSDLGINSD